MDPNEETTVSTTSEVKSSQSALFLVSLLPCQRSLRSLSSINSLQSVRVTRLTWQTAGAPRNKIGLWLLSEFSHSSLPLLSSTGHCFLSRAIMSALAEASPTDSRFIEALVGFVNELKQHNLTAVIAGTSQSLHSFVHNLESTDRSYWSPRY